MKRIFTLLMCLVMVCSLTVGALADAGLGNFAKGKTYTQGRFADVAADAWYNANVAAAYEYALIDGTDENAFSPEGKLTLGQAVALAARINSIYNTGKAEFVQGEVWYQVYVDYCVAQGIFTAGLFYDYTAEATRDQFAMIFAAALPNEALAAVNTVEYGAIPDVPAESSYIYKLYYAGVLGGADDKGSFNPAAGIKRCEAAAIATRMADPTLRLSFTLRAEATETGDGTEPVSDLKQGVKQSREALTVAQRYLVSAASLVAGGGTDPLTTAAIAKSMGEAKSWAMQAGNYALSASKLAEGDTAKELVECSAACKAAAEIINNTVTGLATAQTYVNGAASLLTTIWNKL